jgi:hypothetical protein
MNNEDVPNSDAESSPVTNEKSPKRPYIAPKLKEYGDIRELTQGGNGPVPTDPTTASIPVITG